MNVCRFIVGISLFIFISCGNKDELPSAAIKASDSVQLLDDAGMSPAVISFRGTPSSIRGSSVEKTTDVPFDAQINLNQSPQAYAAIQWGIPGKLIYVELVFIDTKRVEHPFQAANIQQGPDLTALTQTMPVPFPIEEIAMIVLRVDGKEVAWHPAHQKPK